LVELAEFFLINAYNWNNSIIFQIKIVVVDVGLDRQLCWKCTEIPFTRGNSTRA